MEVIKIEVKSRHPPTHTHIRTSLVLTFHVSVAASSSSSSALFSMYTHTCGRVVASLSKVASFISEDFFMPCMHAYTLIYMYTHVYRVNPWKTLRVSPFYILDLHYYNLCSFLLKKIHENTCTCSSSSSSFRIFPVQHTDKQFGWCISVGFWPGQRCYHVQQNNHQRITVLFFPHTVVSFFFLFSCRNNVIKTCMPIFCIQIKDERRI